MNQLVETTPISNKGFQPGHRHSVGNRSRPSPLPCTQVLISQLNELEKSTDRPKIHRVIEKLIALATGYKYKAINKDGEKVTIEVQPDINAIKEIFDRMDGKPRQSIDISAQIEVEDVTAARAKLDKIIELKRNETATVDNG